MSKIAVFGFGPQRWEASTRLFALALRSWHFANTLANAGHDVLLLSIRSAAHEGWPAGKVTVATRGRVRVVSLSEHACHEKPGVIERHLADLGPDCMVGVNREPAAVAVNFARGLPFWADLNGDPMAEAQAKARALGGDWNVNEWYRKLVPVLIRGDRFSTCSLAQKHALVGQLGMVGRLTAKNDGVDLVAAIPNSIDDDELEILGRNQRPERGPGDPFVLLWSGGYNTWTDPDVLFDALELALSGSRELSFVSTGGGIEGHHVDAYARFTDRVRRSRHRDRIHLAGWVQTSELPAYYAGADAAILVDGFCYEGMLGARTRMLDWLAAGLPIVCTRLSEISRELEAAGVALAAECGDSRGLARAILELVADRDAARARGERGRALVHERHRAEVQLAPVLAWAERPVRAPDADHRVALSWGPSLGAALRQHSSLLRAELEENGARGAAAAVGRFALRRLRHASERVGARFGLHDIEEFGTNAPEAPPLEAPRFAAFEWHKRVQGLGQAPRVTVLLLVPPETRADVLGWACAQIARQYYDGWRVLLLETRPAPAELEASLAAATKDLGRDGHIAERLVAGGVDVAMHRLVQDSDYVLLSTAQTLLRPDALAELVWAAREQAADVVFADDRRVDETNVPMPVRRKPGWSPELLLSSPYLGTALLCRSSVFQLASDRVVGWPVDAVCHDVALRVTEQGRRVLHVPLVLSELWTCQTATEQELVREQQRFGALQLEAVQDALWRRGLDADVLRGPRLGALRVRRRVPGGRVVIGLMEASPSAAVERCMAALRQHAPPADVQRLRSQADLVLRDAEWLVLLDSRVLVSRDDWLESLLEQLGRADVASVSPALYWPNGAVAWNGLDPSGTSLLESVAHDVLAPSALCFALSARRMEGESVPTDARARAAWLRSHADSWRTQGLSSVCTPFAAATLTSNNGEVGHLMRDLATSAGEAHAEGAESR